MSHILYKLNLFKYVACVCIIFVIVYHPHCFLLQFFNYCTVKAPTVYPIYKMGSISVLFSNNLMRVRRTFLVCLISQ